MNNKIHCLLAFCLTLFGTYSPGAHGQVDPRKASDIFEEKLIRSGLARLGIDDGYEIVVADSPDLVENTAAEVLQKFLARGGLKIRVVPEAKSTGKKRFLVGRDSNLKDITRLENSGSLRIRDVSAEDDGFHLKRVGPDVAIAGANPRGVLYGVYAFEDFITDGANTALDVRKVPYFRKRGSGPCYTDAFFKPSLMEDFPEEKAAYLSRMGVNQWTDQGTAGTLITFVTSDVFPFLEPPKPDYQRKIKAMSALCRKYGIEQYVFVHEPALPLIAGKLEQYPPEAIGTVRRPWGGDKDGIDRTLCVSSLVVQQHLRNMMKRFVREYPDIKGVQLYNADVSAWLCTPGLCERCRAVCTDHSPADPFAWETQARLVTLLAAAAHEEDPGFDFRFGGIHYYDEELAKLLRAAQGYDSLVSSLTGSDRTCMVPDAATPSVNFLLHQETARKRAIPFYVSAEFNNLEVVPKSLPFPFHVIDALKKYRKWGGENLVEFFGLEPEHNPINSLVMREFQWNPDQDPEKFLTGLARKQFGEKAGKLMYQAWEEIGKAFDMWNDVVHEPFPMEGSQFHTKMGPAIGGLPPSILPEIVEGYNSTLATLARVEPRRADYFQMHKKRAFLDKMNRMNAHLAQATSLAGKAIDATNDREYIGLGYYEGRGGRPTCREYAELNHAAIAVADNICRQRCNMLQAYLLLTELDSARAAGDAESVKGLERQYHELIREDIRVQEEFCELLEGFEKMPPQYTRTSLSQQEIGAFLARTREKIGKMQEYLK